MVLVVVAVNVIIAEALKFQVIKLTCITADVDVVVMERVMLERGKEGGKGRREKR